MNESINEKVSVTLVYNHANNAVIPWKIKWHNRIYTTLLVDFHHLVREDDTLFHVFGVTDGNTFFRIRFNTLTLQWHLEEMSDGVYT